MKKIKTFLLDDESVICDIIRREIEKNEHLDSEFVEVPSGTGREALEILSRMDSPPDLLFIDLRLNNGVTGFDVIDFCLGRFERSSMYIVVLTGCWEGSEDWDRSVKYLEENKIDSLLGKWGIGIVLSEISLILDQVRTR